MSLENDFANLAKEFKNFVNRDLPRQVGQVALKHFDKSWDNKGFTGETGIFKSWAERKAKAGLESDNRGLLIGKGSGALRRSLRVIRASLEGVVIGTSQQYAEIHNEGGEVEIPITPQMRKFFWAKHYEAMKKIGAIQTRESKRSFRGTSTKRYQKYSMDMRTAEGAAGMWKALALTKKESIRFTMPPRQFMGASEPLFQDIEHLVDFKMNKFFS